MLTHTQTDRHQDTKTDTHTHTGRHEYSKFAVDKPQLFLLILQSCTLVSHHLQIDKVKLKTHKDAFALVFASVFASAFSLERSQCFLSYV